MALTRPPLTGDGAQCSTHHRSTRIPLSRGKHTTRRRMAAVLPGNNHPRIPNDGSPRAHP